MHAHRGSGTRNRSEGVEKPWVVPRGDAGYRGHAARLGRVDTGPEEVLESLMDLTESALDDARS